MNSNVYSGIADAGHYDPHRMARRLAAIVIAALVAASAASAAAGWRVVKSASASGHTAKTAVTVDVHRPAVRGVALRLTGRVSRGFVAVTCWKGAASSAWGRYYSRAGVYVLRTLPGAELCDVTASVGGSGRIVVQVLRV